MEKIRQRLIENDCSSIISKIDTSERNKDVVKKYMDGWKQVDIAKEYNITPPRVRVILLNFLRYCNVYRRREREVNIKEQIAFCKEKSENIKLKTEPQTFIDITKSLETLEEILEKKNKSHNDYNQGVSDTLVMLTNIKKELASEYNENWTRRDNEAVEKFLAEYYRRRNI